VRRTVGSGACLAAAALLAGCGSTAHPSASLRISGEGGIGPVLSRADIASADADVDPSTSQSVVLLRLTPDGRRKFHALTMHVADAGRRRQRPLHILLAVDGKVLSRPYVDYHLFPTGLPAQNGIQVNLSSNRAAHDLVAKLNP